MIHDFVPVDDTPCNSLMASIFSQINPFSQYVIQDIFEEEKAEDWQLHESLFKREGYEVNPDNLKKSSS